MLKKLATNGIMVAAMFNQITVNVIFLIQPFLELMSQVRKIKKSSSNDVDWVRSLHPNDISAGPVKFPLCQCDYIYFVGTAVTG